MTNLVQFTATAYYNLGGSFNLSNGEINPTKGYMVSLEHFEQIVEPAYIRISKILEHLSEILEFPYQVTQAEEIRILTFDVFKYVSDIRVFDKTYEDDNGILHLGLWFNSEEKKWYLDLSENISELDEALRLGKERKQIAIWDCKNSKEITL